MLTLSMDTENDAFDREFPGHEVARILRDLANTIEANADISCTYRLRDENGNTVGTADFQIR